MMKNQTVRDWETLVWKRPSEVYGDQEFKIYENIGPNDIKQGKCGDCYFLASLSALAEYPERIKNIFITKEVNEAGCYAVSLFVNGERRTVVVDDYFPYDNHRGTWAFSRPSEDQDEAIGRGCKEIWVLILEKAWAKVFGSY
jgi:calpain-15